MNNKPMLMLAGLALVGMAASGCGGRAGAQSVTQAVSTVGFAAAFTTGLRFNNDPTTAVATAATGFSNRPSGSGKVVCGYTEQNASPVDADGDGIAVSQSWTYDYSSVSCGVGTPGFDYTFTGTSTETDLDDTKKWQIGGFTYGWDFRSTYSFPVIVSGSGTYPAGSYTYDGMGTYTSRQVGSAYRHVGDYNGVISWISGSYSGSYTYDGDFTYVVTPDVATSASAHLAGSVEINGTWTYSGRVLGDGHGSSSPSGEDVDITFTARSVGLRYDNTCTKYWSQGSFFYDVGNGHTLEYRYGCTTEEIYFDGALYTPPV